MRTLIFIALGSVAAFAAGLVGTYFVLPVVAPDLVEARRMEADSLAMVDSLATAHAFLADSLAAVGDASPPDSLLEAAPADGVLGDSLALLHQKLAEYEALIETYRSEISATEAQRLQASELAATLIKLEDRELGRVLNQLDFEVLDILYAESSARNRARLLGALDPSRTAVFVRRATSKPTSAVPDTPVPPGPDETPRETATDVAAADLPR